MKLNKTGNFKFLCVIGFFSLIWLKTSDSKYSVKVLKIINWSSLSFIFCQLKASVFSKCHYSKIDGTGATTGKNPQSAHSVAEYLAVSVSTHLHWISSKFGDYCLFYGENNCFMVIWFSLSRAKKNPNAFLWKNPWDLKADTHEGFCSRSMLQGHVPWAKLLRVYQWFHGYTSSSGAEFPPRKMLHDI